MNQAVQPAAAGTGLEYVGFWARVAAALVDSLLILLLIAPILYAVYGPDYFLELIAPILDAKYGPGYSSLDAGGSRGVADMLINFVLPAIAVILFWRFRQATPGKMMIGARIVDAVTGAEPSTGQLIGRYFGYYASIIPLGLGLLWVAFDGRKQGWHDKLAGTVVVRDRK